MVVILRTRLPTPRYAESVMRKVNALVIVFPNTNRWKIQLQKTGKLYVLATDI